MDNNLGSDKNLQEKIMAYKKARENFEPMMYMSRRAYDGKHFVEWNRETKQLQDSPITRGEFNQLPEISKQADSFENFLLSTDFTFTLVPVLLSDDDALQDSLFLSLLAQQQYNQLRETTVFADFIHYSLFDNVSFIEATPDDQKKLVTYNQYTAFDILFDPTIKDWEKQKLVIKVFKKDISEMRDSKLYNIPADYRASGGVGTFNTWQDMYDQERYNNFIQLKSNEGLFFECQILEPDGLRIKTIDFAGVVLRNDKYANVKKITITPIRIYSGEWYQNSFVYRQISMNRTIDLISNRMEALILRLAKGGWLVQDEEDLNGSMTEDMGQIIRYSGTKPEAIQMQNVPPFLFQWFANMISMAERYGMNSLLSGNLPTKASGIRANNMIESLRSLTAQNNYAPINNMKNAIKRILETTFMFYYEMWDTPQDVIYTDFTGKTPLFVSDKVRTLWRDENTVGVPKDFKRFDVELDNGLGYTLEERKNAALQLRKLNIITDETVKRIFKLGSSAYLLEAEAKPIYDTNEFKDLLTKYPTLTPEQQKAVVIVLQTLGEQMGNRPDTVNKANDLLKGLPGQNGNQNPNQQTPTQPLQSETVGIPTTPPVQTLQQTNPAGVEVPPAG